MSVEGDGSQKGLQEKPPVNEHLNSMSVIGQQISKLETEAAGLHSELRGKEFTVLENILIALASMSSHISEIKSSLDILFQQNVVFDQKLKSVESEVKGIASDITGLSPAVVAIEKNLREVRNLTERVAERAETLSGEFIERHIKEPTIEHIGSLYNSIRQMAQDNLNEDQLALLEEARQLLSAQGARIIEPEAGSVFDPREHRPVRKVETLSKELHGKVARLFRSGFGYNGRVVKHAVVEILVYDNNTEKRKEKGEQNELTTNKEQ